MILIFSEENDESTNNVIDWLNHYNYPFIRVNENCTIQIDQILIRDKVFDFQLKISSPYYPKPITIQKTEIDYYWYRRGAFILQAPMIMETKDIVNEYINSLNKYLWNENLKINDFFHKYFNDIPHIGSYIENKEINKIFNLYKAQKEGLKVPESLIIKDKSFLTKFLQKKKKCVLKGIDRNGINLSKNINVGNFTKILNLDSIHDIPENFNYSLVQEYIDKKMDIRIFYINKRIISTAIFSQNDPKTTIDFRDYNEEKPNRIVPFKIPNRIEEKISSLMENLNYNSGSIDFVLDQKDQLFFLEINPVGQYGFISEKINVSIDQCIALNLIKSNG